MGYDFELHYKPGRENKVADALSRLEAPTFLAISGPTVPWLNELRSYFTDTTKGKRSMTELEQNPSSLPHHKAQNSLVYFQGRLLIPNILHVRFNFFFFRNFTHQHWAETREYKPPYVA